MGNCLKKKESAVEWGGEEWDFLSSKQRKSQPSAPSSEADSMRRRMAARRDENKGKKVRFDAHVQVFGGDYDDETLKAVEEEKKQVRIRITKKQLEELLGKVELESLSVHEMLSCLISEVHLSEPQEEKE